MISLLLLCIIGLTFVNPSNSITQCSQKHPRSKYFLARILLGTRIKNDIIDEASYELQEYSQCENYCQTQNWCSAMSFHHNALPGEAKCLLSKNTAVKKYSMADKNYTTLFFLLEESPFRRRYGEMTMTRGCDGSISTDTVFNLIQVTEIKIPENVTPVKWVVSIHRPGNGALLLVQKLAQNSFKIVHRFDYDSSLDIGKNVLDFNMSELVTPPGTFIATIHFGAGSIGYCQDDPVDESEIYQARSTGEEHVGATATYDSSLTARRRWYRVSLIAEYEV